MDEAGGKSEKRKMLPCGDHHQYVFFDHSHSSVMAFYPKEANLGNFKNMRRMAMDALERARAEGTQTNSFVVQTLDRGATSEISDEDHEEEVKSDAESIIRQHIKDSAAENPSDEDSCVDAVMKEKRVRRKLEMLAQMVGVDSRKPGVVLDEVVRVLRDLERNASQL